MRGAGKLLERMTSVVAFDTSEHVVRIIRLTDTLCVDVVSFLKISELGIHCADLRTVVAAIQHRIIIGVSSDAAEELLFTTDDADVCSILALR